MPNTHLQDVRKTQIEHRSLMVSCVVPVHNEAECVTPFLTALSNELQKITQHFEIIVVDDGSKDASADCVTEFQKKQKEVKLLCFSRNFGKETAIFAGLKHATGDVTVIIDADFQHPVKYIHTFLEKWEIGRAHV